MSAGDPSSGKPDAPPFVQSVLHALSRMQRQETVRPEELVARAHALLVERFGEREGRVVTAFAQGNTSLIAEHTHFIEGFGIVMPLPHGVAVAIRPSADGEARGVLGTSEGVGLRLDAWEEGRASRAGLEPWACVLQGLGRLLTEPDVPPAFEAAVVTTVPTACADGYYASLAVAFARGLGELLDLRMDRESLLRLCRRVIARCLNRPFGVAHLMVALAGEQDDFVLTDTARLEQIGVARPSRDRLGWGLVDTNVARDPGPKFYNGRLSECQAALAILRRQGFPELETLRDIEHRDLYRMLELVPATLAPIVRHIVGENARVPKIVAALRRGDWQVLGALLYMSHASLRDDWRSTVPEVDFIVSQAEASEGLYGARMVGAGFGGCVLVVGQPFAVPQFLDRIGRSYQSYFGHPADTILL